MRTTYDTPNARFAPAVALAVALAAAPAVWAQTPAQDSAAHRTWNIPGRVPTSTTPTTTTPTTTNPATTSPTATVQGIGDTAFVREVRTNNLLEIRLASVAAKRSTNSAVKQFAQRMITDHTAMGNEWTSLASRLRLATTSALDVNQQQVVSQLSSAPAADFDRQYMGTAVQFHQNAIGLLQNGSASAQSPEVRQLAAKGLPIVQQHLTLAQQIATQVGASVATNTTGQPQTTPQVAKNNNRNNNGNNNARGDQAYVQELWRGHTMQVQLAEIAQNKARTPQVKSFASNMRKDFQDYLDRWTNLAQKNNITLPNHIGNLHQDKVDRLKKASGKDVDRVYLDIVKETVGSMVPYYQKEGRDAQSSAIRNLVNDELPTIRQRLDRAETLDRQVTTASAQSNDKAKDKDKDKDKDRSLSNSK
jgi:putative membrane protein